MKPTAEIPQKSYYAAANTQNGFYSLFNQIFSPEKYKHIYILKGGPGCGKSTLIKRISQKAANSGYAVENYYCSSSPSSLDGVIIPQLSTAILDGTSPHTAEPAYPAACENIINLGSAWNADKAFEFNEKLRELSKAKKDAYTKAYAYLSSCGNAVSVANNCMEKFLLAEKLQKAVARLCTKINAQNQDGKIAAVFTDCVCSHGNVHLDTFERNSQTKYFIKDFARISPVFFEELKNALVQKGVNLTLALNPLNPQYINGVATQDSKISFTMYNDDLCRKLDKNQIYYKVINLARFCNTDNYKKQKVYCKYAEKAYSVLYNGAIKQLSTAAALHDEIEKIYFNVTDFSVTEKISQDLENKIFG